MPDDEERGEDGPPLRVLHEGPEQLRRPHPEPLVLAQLGLPDLAVDGAGGGAAEGGLRAAAA